MLEKYLAEVSLKVASQGKLKPGNHYNSPTPTLGLTVPQSRAACKEGYSFLQLPAPKILRVFDYIWNHARYFEEMSQALYYYERKSLSDQELQTISGWIERCDNWAHSDYLSAIYARALEEKPTTVMPMLKSWNCDPNPWKRRQSAVSLLYYSRLRKKTPAFALMIEMVEALLKDSDYYVQKGAGWAIREIYNCFPEQTLAFIEKHVRRIPPAAWQASTEKLAPAVKKRLLALRQSEN